MKKTKFFYLFFLLALAWLLPSCKKDRSCENNCPPSGRVLEYGTDKPIAGAKVQLQEYASNGILNGGYFYTVEEVTADSTGAYQCSEFGDIVNATKDRYFSDDETSEGISTVGDEPIDIHLFPYAWLKVVYRNVSGAYMITQPFGIVENQLYLDKGEERAFTNIIKGNKEFKYVFSCYQDSSIALPANLINIDSNGKNIELFTTPSWPAGHYVNFTANGHDTTTITITF